MIPPSERARFRKLYGSLNYLVSRTRPDIATATNFLAWLNSNPAPARWLALIRILRYLRGTSDFGLFYPYTNSDNAVPKIVAFSDSDWAQAVDDQKSTSRYVLQLRIGPGVSSPASPSSEPPAYGGFPGFCIES